MNNHIGVKVKYNWLAIQSSSRVGRLFRKRAPVYSQRLKRRSKENAKGTSVLNVMYDWNSHFKSDLCLTALEWPPRINNRVSHREFTSECDIKENFCGLLNRIND